jgi:hypothetical protein
MWNNKGLALDSLGNPEGQRNVMTDLENWDMIVDREFYFLSNDGKLHPLIGSGNSS